MSRKNLQKLLFALSALCLCAAALDSVYQTAYQRGFDAKARMRAVVTIQRSPKYMGNVQTGEYHGDWGEHIVSEDDAVYFDTIDAADALGFYPCG